MGRVRAGRRATRQFRDAPRDASATRSIRCSASCSARTRNEPPAPFRAAPTGISSCSSATTPRSREVAAEFGLDTYPNQIEIITSEQMLDAYATSGLPVGYPHWSYGKEFIRNEQALPARHAGRSPTKSSSTPTLASRT